MKYPDRFFAWLRVYFDVARDDFEGYSKPLQMLLYNIYKQLATDKGND